MTLSTLKRIQRDFRYANLFSDK